MTAIGSFFSGMKQTFGYTNERGEVTQNLIIGKIIFGTPVVSVFTGIVFFKEAHEARLAARAVQNLSQNSNLKIEYYGQMVGSIVQGIFYLLQMGWLVQLFVDAPLAARAHYIATHTTANGVQEN